MHVTSDAASAVWLPSQWRGRTCGTTGLATSGFLNSTLRGSETCLCEDFPSHAFPGAPLHDKVVELADGSRAVRNSNVSWPLAYGLGCGPHDLGINPYCLQVPVPSWCTRSWCFVNPATVACDRSHHGHALLERTALLPRTAATHCCHALLPRTVATHCTAASTTLLPPHCCQALYHTSR